ncbi:MAG: hypothetical protein US60_C0015G0051 [Microgenomates group bacterium GW2011_GWC1_37_8]|uniref:Uncharacterized protein n=1 Tax=Candidatus Woesebacteria bacterium GW2011_GWB1_38_8 TaxID=1618570 RepID=A0A0G0LDV4_9BACT|nr:MAG: hypothetical protein US60_C0015G0051 [Microgenomates group bacterium GW2011_GWC1_37_8]KKQ86090.1 MAG: hypothetical protein UT08_C0002G0112 [Candidatus Woesebacteria bacterium GW2011_GWB1_38_8]
MKKYGFLVAGILIGAGGIFWFLTQNQKIIPNTTATPTP